MLALLGWCVTLRVSLWHLLGQRPLGHSGSSCLEQEEEEAWQELATLCWHKGSRQEQLLCQRRVSCGTGARGSVLGVMFVLRGEDKHPWGCWCSSWEECEV